eukprot:2510250-Rhodomonas_salina.1
MPKCKLTQLELLGRGGGSRYPGHSLPLSAWACAPATRRLCAPVPPCTGITEPASELELGPGAHHTL